jgi:exodeoxyribonuclease-1
MAQVRRSSLAELATKTFVFKDARLSELLFRYRARNFPETLGSLEYQKWRSFCHLRRTDASAGVSLILDDLQQRAVELAATETTTEPQKDILRALLSYVEGL